MVVLNKNSFKLPFVDKEKFVLLLKLGLDRNQGSYCIKSYNNIEKLVDTILSILKAEKIVFLQTCSICGRDFPCSDCKYYESCATRDLPFHCVCPQCLKEGRLYEEYAEDSDK